MNKKMTLASGVIGAFLIAAGGIGLWNDFNAPDAAAPQPEDYQEELNHALAHEMGDGSIPENGVVLSACTKDGLEVTMNAVITGQVSKDGKTQPFSDLVNALFKQAARTSNGADISTADWQNSFTGAYMQNTTGEGIKLIDTKADIMWPVLSGKTCTPN